MTYGCKIMVSLTLCGFFGPPCIKYTDMLRLWALWWGGGKCPLSHVSHDSIMTTPLIHMGIGKKSGDMKAL